MTEQELKSAIKTYRKTGLCYQLRSASLIALYQAGSRDFRGALLRGAYLEGADLRGANLRGANLRDAYLRDADLGGAYLGGAYLRDAYLRDAYLGGADLRDADLGRADLDGADLSDAYLGGADLSDANMSGAVGLIFVGPIGSTGRIAYFVRHETAIMAYAGGFWGTTERLLEKAERDADAQTLAEYRAAVALATVRFAR